MASGMGREGEWRPLLRDGGFIRKPSTRDCGLALSFPDPLRQPDLDERLVRNVALVRLELDALEQ